MASDHPDHELMVSIQRAKADRARASSPGRKFWDGLELFEDSCARMRSGIRGQFPQLDEAGVQAELTRRLDLLRRRDRMGAEGVSRG